MRLTTSPPSLSQLSRQCEILNISQPYRLSRPVTGIALLFLQVDDLFGPKRDGVTGRKLHNEELHNLYSSPSIIRIIKSRWMRWAGHVARLGEKRNVYSLLVGKPEGKRPLGRPRRRRMDNIKMDLLETGLNVVTGLVWLRIGTGGELL
jgi:hypothetical protein